MKKLWSLCALLLCVAVAAADLPVPEELIGKQTVGIITIDAKAIKFDQIVSTIKEKLGTAPDEAAMGQFKEVIAKFKAAGGQSINIMINIEKGTKAEAAADGMVVVVTPSEEGDVDKLKAFAAEAAAPLMDKTAPGCPKKIGESLVWHSAKFKLPKGDEERAKSFSEAYVHLPKTSTVAIVFAPDEDAVALAEEGIKEAKPDEAETVKALLTATAYCIYTDFGAAAAPALKILVLAADADGAEAINKAAIKALGDLKKDSPPPIVAFIDSLKPAVAGSNVQMNIDLNALAEGAKGLLGGGK